MFVCDNNPKSQFLMSVRLSVFKLVGFVERTGEGEGEEERDGGATSLAIREKNAKFTVSEGGRWKKKQSSDVVAGAGSNGVATRDSSEPQGRENHLRQEADDSERSSKRGIGEPIVGSEGHAPFGVADSTRQAVRVREGERLHRSEGGSFRWGYRRRLVSLMAVRTGHGERGRRRESSRYPAMTLVTMGVADDASDQVDRLSRQLGQRWQGAPVMIEKWERVCCQLHRNLFIIDTIISYSFDAVASLVGKSHMSSIKVLGLLGENECMHGSFFPDLGLVEIGESRLRGCGEKRIVSGGFFMQQQRCLRKTGRDEVELSGQKGVDGGYEVVVGTGMKNWARDFGRRKGKKENMDVLWLLELNEHWKLVLKRGCGSSEVMVYGLNRKEGEEKKSGVLVVLETVERIGGNVNIFAWEEKYVQELLYESKFPNPLYKSGDVSTVHRSARPSRDYFGPKPRRTQVVTPELVSSITEQVQVQVREQMKERLRTLEQELAMIRLQQQEQQSQQEDAPTDDPIPPPASTKDSCSNADHTDINIQYEFLVDKDPPRALAIGVKLAGDQTIHGTPLLPTDVQVRIDNVRDPQARVSWELRTFGVEFHIPLYIEFSDAFELIGGDRMLNISCIQLWCMYMDTVALESGRGSIYGFLEPQTTQPSRNTLDSRKSYMQTWMTESKREIYVAPYIDAVISRMIPRHVHTTSCHGSRQSSEQKSEEIGLR
ncbi:hypothetical protein V8G54_023490 [Vigna mungo]|uniref:Uncharacterized protein n=1 Tax=Vigna mungo TaxID=3915 RepID=A0AAQ3N497_VIGMU